MKVYTVFKAVTKNWLRARSGLFFSILFPILLLVVFGAIFGGIGGGSSKFSLFVQNLDANASGQPTDVSQAFVDALNSTNTFAITTIPPSENATDYTRQTLGPMGGNIRILVISKGFQDNLINGTLKVRLGICIDTLNQSYSYFAANSTQTQAAMIQQGANDFEQYSTQLPDTNATLTIMLDPSDTSAATVQSIITSIANSFNYQTKAPKT